MATRVLRLQLERELAHAHKWLSEARATADALSDQELEEDLFQLSLEVHRLNVASLKRASGHWSSKSGPPAQRVS